MRFNTFRLLSLTLATSLVILSISAALPAQADGDPVFVGAGDIAACGVPGAAETAALLDKIPGIVFAAGDNVSPDGTLDNYKQCFEPTWGRFKNRMRAVPGNHDFNIAQGKEYFTYFGAAAGPAGQGYYSFELGAWHIVMLNSNAIHDLYTKEIPWLKADLAAHPKQCILAVAHHPAFSSGIFGITYRSWPLFKVLYDAGASVLVSGSAHNYERFAAQNLANQKEPARGIRQFVVGTGGATRTSFGRIWKTTEARDDTTWGVLKLTLHPGSYDWEFVPVEGGTYHDSGHSSCSTLPVPAATTAATATQAVK